MFILPAAPTLGGYLQEYVSWRASFVFMSFYILAALIAVIFGFKESNQHHHKDKLQLHFISITFRQLLTSRIFMGITVCTFLSYGAFFAWLTTGPILLIKEIGISPLSFGWITGLGGGVAYGVCWSVIWVYANERWGGDRAVYVFFAT